MKEKVLFIVLGVIALVVFAYGLHIRVVTDGVYTYGRYDQCDVVELHNLKLTKSESVKGEIEIICPDKVSIWWAL